jgi:signal transduction protein with GAF and PtsI domain
MTDEQNAELVQQLRAVAEHAGSAFVPMEALDALRASCHAARVAFGAQASSIALVDPSGMWLDYMAADGPVDDAVEGMLIAVGRGVAGYVAQTGETMVLDDVERDPRFARDVAEQLQYIPKRLLCAPIAGPGQQTIGVLSILDRDDSVHDPVGLAAVMADQAALTIRMIAAATGLGAAVSSGLADVVSGSAPDLVAALRAPSTGRASSMSRVAALLAELDALGPAEQDLAFEVVEEVLRYARAKRKR